jgi:hypothetical protein
MVNREEDRQRVQEIIAAREQAQADAVSGAAWMSRGLAALEPEQPVQADPRVVHQLPVAAEDQVNPYERARQVRAAQAQAEADPYMAAFREERKTAIKTGGLHGQSGYSDRPGGNPSPWRAR